ncbi:MAG: TIGR04282 family arsenosugar biosynthesis glycosyltransferase [Acidobacteriia bacterium]|nr:TIGR04282 family arsenosugar biosynthesis glycosyltransferase [Terriglobia bacterium]
MAGASPDRREALLVFLRYPIPGRTKTRLVPLLGEEGAAAVYRRVAEQVLRQASSLDRTAISRIAWVDPAERVRDAAAWIGPRFDTRPQPAEDLGARLERGFAAAFAEGARNVVAIGTDCPDVNAALLARAFDALDEFDAVLGPARDGGYYLLGLSRPLPVFRDVPWSTERVARATLELLERAGARVKLLETLRDLDTPEDLRALATVWPELLSPS